MTRRYGRAPRGQRVVDAVPHGHWLTTTFVAGLRENGIIAPLVVDGPMRGEIFKAYVEQMLAPALSPGDDGDTEPATAPSPELAIRMPSPPGPVSNTSRAKTDRKEM